MILGRDQRSWLVGAGIASLAGAVAYLIYVRLSPNGPRGGSAPGLLFAFAGTALIVFECLLSLRKKYPASPLGRVSTWLRAHIWLGLLSLLLILMHSGFRWGHGLAAWIMWMLAIITASGVLGLVLQNYLPRVMMERVPRETLYDLIPQVIVELRREADERVEFVTADLGVAGEAEAEFVRAGGVKQYFDPAQKASAQEKIDAVIAQRKSKPQIEIEKDSAESLRAHYLQEVRPFLASRPPVLSRRLFRTRESLASYFQFLRTIIPVPAHPVIKDLETICDERRQLATQARLHHWLHGWLYLHVPLSMAFLVLTLVHAVMSLRY
jgi:hypothetical protein